MKSSIIGIVAFLLISFSSVSQEKGYVRGNILDGEFGGPMIGAAITVLEKPGYGTTTDFDGNYSLPLEPGTYTLQISFISYEKKQYPNTIVKSGEIVIIDAVIKSSVEQLAAVEVVAEVRRNSEVAMLMDMRKASTVQDGLSSQTFRKLGDSNLSGAIKRVTGVTVQSGKYVYVRGLGDRYTKTTLNGMSLPGLDPDVNAIQINIFPTSVLENVAVSKTFSPDLVGDFTGGLVNVVTKSFPDKKTTNIRAGIRYVPGMHFNKDFILYERTGMDVIGLGYRNRKLPFDKELKVPNPVLNDVVQETTTKSFDKTLAVKKASALPNGSFSINHGNQINKKEGLTYGYNLVFNYSNQTTFYQGFQSNNFMKDNERAENQLVKQVSRVGDVGKNSVLWSGLVSGSIKKKKSSYSLILLHSQSGETTAAKRVNQDLNQNQSTLIEDILTYSQKSLTTSLLNGKHKIDKAEIKWTNAFSLSKVYDPDFRESKISITDGDTSLSTGNGAGIFRFWRALNEINETFKVDVKVPISEEAFVKFGALGTMKWRDFETVSYKHTRKNLSDVSIDPNWYLQEENIWSADIENPNNENGTYTIGTFQKANSFNARQNIFSGYALMNQRLMGVLKLIYGARVESTQMYYTGQNNSGSDKYFDENVLDQVNVLPSLNVVWSLSEDMNLRLGANRTLARPSFKEKSIAQIYDPITKRTFNGNIDLKQTNINNFDIRYEYFLTPKELISVGAFYKQFDGHIELVSFDVAPDQLKPRNSGQAETFGLEFEIRKGMPENDSKILGNLFASANFTFVESRVDLNTVQVNNAGLTEFELRENNLRYGEKLSQYRPMSGQSPYAVNMALTWEEPEKRKTSISLAYNVQGDKLSIIASGRVPDIYTLAFNSLNFNIFRNFGKEDRSRLTFRVNNILNDDRTLVYRSYGSEDAIYTSFNPGIGIGLKYSITF